MEFRKIVAICTKEYAAHSLGTEPRNVTADDMTTFVTGLKCRVTFVVNIFKIIFGAPPRSMEVRRYVERWFQTPNLLIGVR